MTALPHVIAWCIGCARHDGGSAPFIWRRVDYRTGLGVCEDCPQHEARWDSGDRTPAAIDPAEADAEIDIDMGALLLPGEVEWTRT